MFRFFPAYLIKPLCVMENIQPKHISLIRTQLKRSFVRKCSDYTSGSQSGRYRHPGVNWTIQGVDK